MREFKFSDKSNLKIKLNGVEFEIDVTDIEFLSNLSEIDEKVRSIDSQVSEGESLIKRAKEVADIYVNSIDVLLGKGSVKKIFKGKISYVHLIEVFAFIMEEITSYSEENSISFSKLTNVKSTKKAK